jgi:hemin uptake protein HemP
MNQAYPRQSSISHRLLPMKIAVWVCLMLGFCGIRAQEYDKVWAVGLPITKMAFDGDSILLSQFRDDTTLQCFITLGSICDRQGNFLMATNGISVHNRYGGLMPNGDSLSYPSQYYNDVYPMGMPSREGVVIIPDPGDTNQYYIFHYTPTDSTLPAGISVATHFYYSKVDMRLDSGKGAVTEKNVDILHDELLSWSRLAACRHANGRDWWIIKNAWHTNIYYEFLLTPEGVQGPFVQQIGPMYGALQEQPAFSVFSPDGSKYSSMTGSGNIVVMDFDRCSGLLLNPTSFFNSNSYDPLNHPYSGALSAAFSSSGRFLYVNNSIELNQYDLSVSPIHDSVRICTLTDTTDFFHMDVLQLAPNGKIYISCFNGGSYKMHVINQPDSFGLACNFHLYGQDVLSPSPVAIPYFPNYKLGALPGSCDTIHTAISTIEQAHPAFATISPNPATDHAILLYYTHSNTTNQAEMYDVTGRLVWSATTTGPHGTLPIDVSGMGAGMYTVRFTVDGRLLMNEKLVVVR